MNILYFIPGWSLPDSGAVFVHTYEIAANIGKLGHNIKILAKSPHARLLGPRRYKCIDINYVRFPTTFRLQELLNIPAAFESHVKFKKIEESADLVHERFHVPLFWVKREKPFILEVNNPYVEEYEEHYKRAFFKGFVYQNRKKQFRSCNAIITQTTTLKEMLSKFTDKPIYVIPNGVNISLFKPAVPNNNIKELYDLKDNILITFVGSFYKWAGISQIPFIAKKITEKYGNVRFLIVGAGLLYKNFIENLPHKLRKHVIPVGFKKYEDIPKFLAASDILFVPFDVTCHQALNRYGFWWSPIKLFEYMASGKPIVSYNFKEVRNIVRDAGLLARPKDITQFTKYLSQLIEDENLRKKLGMRGREIAEKEYSWEKRAKETLEVYQRVLKDSKL